MFTSVSINDNDIQAILNGDERALKVWAKILEAWLKEHENFDPNKKSTTARKDDWVDATGTAFNTVAQSKVLVTPKYHSLSNYKTLASDLLSPRRF